MENELSLFVTVGSSLPVHGFLHSRAATVRPCYVFFLLRFGLDLVLARLFLFSWSAENKSAIADYLIYFVHKNRHID